MFNNILKVNRKRENQIKLKLKKKRSFFSRNLKPVF